MNYTPEMAECRGLAPLPRRIDLLSKQSRFACPVDIPKLVKASRVFLRIVAASYFRETAAERGRVLRMKRTLRMRPALTFNSVISDVPLRVNSMAAPP